MTELGATAPVGRAGRNLPVAVAVGVALGALVLGTLYTVREFFVALVVMAISIAIYEMCRVLRAQAIEVPMATMVAASFVMLVAAYAEGLDALGVSLGLTLMAVAASRLALPRTEFVLRDIAVSSLVIVYLPLLAAFAMVMLAAPDGADRVVVYVLAVVCNDTGGYAAGVMFGSHRLAPHISPKKSWEGLAGSVLLAVSGTALAASLLLDCTWWEGALVGCAAAVTATLGDLGESMLKRDLGVKDMGSLLPEHGGVMDRLDSLLPTAPVVALAFSVLLG